jgi:hypothetical protein
MKKLTGVFISFLLSISIFAQDKIDANLNRRLQTYMKLTRELKFEEIMNYTHPKMFALAPRDEMVKLFRQTYDNDQFKMLIDSTSIITIGPSFKVGVTDYRKVDYGMKLNIQFKDSAATSDSGFVKTIIENLKQGFPGGDVNFDHAKKAFIVRASSFMFAIRDNELSEWMFLGYQKNEEMVKLLYPQEVIDHFKLL